MVTFHTILHEQDRLVQYRKISTTKIHSAGQTCTTYTRSRPLRGVVPKKFNANGCNINSQQCWVLQCIMGRIQPIGLAVSKETMCNVPAWHKQCLNSCANGSNILALCFGNHRTKEMLGVVDSKFDWFQTLCNNMQQGGRNR